jgi:hypothetical protein
LDPRPPLRPYELREEGEWSEPQGEHAAHDETERGIWGRRREHLSQEICTALDATHNLFQSGDDRGRMARGLWEAYTVTIGMNNIHEVNQKTIAKLPTLLLRTQLAQLGIQLEQHLNQTEAARRAKIEQTLATLGGEQPNSKPYEAMGEPRHMTAFCKVITTL